MIVKIKIKQKLFGKKIDINKIISLSGMESGSYDEHSVLEWYKENRPLILFQEDHKARGIRISIQDSEVRLSLNLPTSKEEIVTFYDLIRKITEYLEVHSFIRNTKKAKLNEIDTYIKEDIDNSIKELNDIEQKAYFGKITPMLVLCYPISIGAREAEKIDGSIERFGCFLNDIQKRQINYATPTILTRNDTHTFLGVYAFSESVDTILPKTTSAIYGRLPIQEYFVSLPGDSLIRYRTFMELARVKEEFDADRNVYSLLEEEIRDLANHNAVNLLTLEKVHGYYFGPVLDNCYLRQVEAKEKKLEGADVFSAYSHGAIFLKWMYDHDLLSDDILNAEKNLRSAFESIQAIRILLANSPVLKGRICAEYFKEEGRAFAESYYRFSYAKPSKYIKSKIKLTHLYPNDIDHYAKQYFQDHALEHYDEEYASLQVPYDDAYISFMYASIDTAWHEFCEKIGVQDTRSYE